MILLTGITGKVGGATADALLEKGIKFRALVRDKEKAAGYAAKGVELVQGDLGDSASVEAALDGCDKAVLILPNSKEQGEMEVAFVESASNSGIKHFVKLSSPEAVPGTNSPIPLAHIAAEEAVRNSGMDYTIVRPNFFMQNLIGYGAAAKEAGKISLPMGKGTAALTDCKDAGAFIAEVLTTDGHFGKSYDISGPELLTFDEIAQCFAEVLDREVVYDDCEPAGYFERIRPFLSSDWHADSVAILFGEIADNTTPGEVTDTFQKIVGREAISFTEFLRQNL
jgi:uncharacterized protein YbjT (DUF2867 family)